MVPNFMAQAIGVRQSGPSLITFYAKTTFSEKAWRVANNALFSAAVYSGYALASGNVRNIPRIVYYISLALAVRKIVATVLGYCTYFAITRTQAELEALEEVEVEDIERQRYTVETVILNKSGVSYTAKAITHPTIAGNGNWCLNALGNYDVIEEKMGEIARENFKRNFNTLIINGPAVGKSFLGKLWVFPTRYQFGAGFEAGLQYLETKAKYIAIRAHSIGNGMVSEAILQHDFKIGSIAYLLISDRTFSRLSAIARAFVGVIAPVLFTLSGAELDGVAAAQKWTDLGLPQIIIQNGIESGTDEIIPDDVGLAKEFRDYPDKKLLLSRMRHNGPLPEFVEQRLDGLIKNFLLTVPS